MAAAQIESVQKTFKLLQGFNPAKVPQVLAFNKIDKLEGSSSSLPEESLQNEWPGVVGECQISARTGAGLEDLAEVVEKAIVERTEFGMHVLEIKIPYTEAAQYSRLRGPPPMAKIESEEFTEDGYHLHVVSSPDVAELFARFVV